MYVHVGFNGVNDKERLVCLPGQNTCIDNLLHWEKPLNASLDGSSEMIAISKKK